ncbi:MAG TPA: 4Fe-4S dicluster domain-containing protein [Kiritimatiellia bacterium]|nr:4Fe-4S dicluster domain-containing protein [Kiritimatiellia bacterium]HRZ11557.1 4Fe-4S dicluster domain-containing protein [Kiritimatiellia bacterium]HSA16892.1 4Fe-4S dicluster domain-containing protein [Kiritimatiellia bacterium]
MSIKKIGPAALERWVDGLIGRQTVIGVQAKGDKFAFAPLAKTSALRLDYDVAVTAPKAFLQPPCETLLRFNPKGYESVVDEQPFVLFGVHPYDAAAILQMDVVFAEGQADIHYLKRRAQATLVVSDVQQPSANVFAGCMNTAVLEQGGDVMLTRIGDAYLVESRSDKGAALVKSLAGEPDAAPADLQLRKKTWDDNRKRLRRHELKVKPGDLPALLARSYDHPVWEEKSKRCFSCGSCNLVCPTCYCFNVRDDVRWDLQSGERVRTWDGCMLAEFALVAGGHNFRKKKPERYRHRYLRKGQYLFEQHRQIACVGCGRCIGACVTKIANPVEIYNRLAEGPR